MLLFSRGNFINLSGNSVYIRAVNDGPKLALVEEEGKGEEEEEVDD